MSLNHCGSGLKVIYSTNCHMTSSAVKKISTKLISNFENEEQGCFIDEAFYLLTKIYFYSCLHHLFFEKRFVARQMHCCNLFDLYSAHKKSQQSQL